MQRKKLVAVTMHVWFFKKNAFVAVKPFKVTGLLNTVVEDVRIWLITLGTLRREDKTDVRDIKK